MSRKRSRRLLQIPALLIAAALPLAACGSSDDGAAAAPVTGTWDQIVAAAEGEGKVTLYSSQGVAQLEDLEARFEKAYPKIDLEFVRGVDGDLAPKVEAESKTGNGIADVFVSASLPWVVANVATFDKPQGPAFDAPEYDRSKSVPEGSYFLVNAAILTFGWNTDLYPAGLTDYTGLLDPALGGGKIGVIKPGSPSIVDFYLYLQENYGADFLEKLAAQKPRIYPSSLPMGQAVTSGEIAAGSFVQPLIDEKASGAPVDWALADKTWGALFQGALLKSGPHPNAAQVLSNFLITQEGQTAVARKSAAVLPNIEGAVDTTANVRRQDLSQLTPDKVREFQDTWESLFEG